MMALCFTSCGPKSGSIKEDGKVSYIGTYTFTCSGGQLDEDHDNKLQLNSTSATKDVFPIDFYVIYDYFGSFKIQGTGSYSGNISTGSTLNVKGLYFKVGSSSVNGSGTLYINSLDTNNDGKKTGTASYEFAEE